MSGRSSPYEGLPASAFWRSGVVGQDPAAIAGLYRKKFEIARTTQVATAGSCFAQHIARNLTARGFCVLDMEPAPPGLSEESAARFGFGLFSARYANIYTARQLRQVVEEARGRFAVAEPIWERDGRYFDAMRPSVEPGGLPTPDLVRDHRDYHLKRVQLLLQKAELFVFTLGLTETWMHTETGTVYPTAPGTIAGRHDPGVYSFKNFTAQDVYDDLRAFFALAREFNPKMRFLLTVSPVPLTATASGEHVLSATVYSKSVLRAVAGQLYHEDPDVDYFPSYEIITGALARGAYFEDNLRSVSADGVAAAMSNFFAEHDPGGAPKAEPAVKPQPRRARKKTKEDIVCEDILLEAFSE